MHEIKFGRHNFLSQNFSKLPKFFQSIKYQRYLKYIDFVLVAWESLDRARYSSALEVFRLIPVPPKVNKHMGIERSEAFCSLGGWDDMGSRKRQRTSTTRTRLRSISGSRRQGDVGEWDRAEILFHFFKFLLYSYSRVHGDGVEFRKGFGFLRNVSLGSRLGKRKGR